MKKTTCADCGHRFTEDWPKGRTAVRCGNRDNGRYYGRVTEIYPSGRPEFVSGTPAPVWCALYGTSEERN